LWKEGGGKSANLNAKARFFQVDITDEDSLKQVFDTVRPEVVCHQAAQHSVAVSTKNPKLDARVNVLGLLNVLTNCTRAGARKIIFASSGATYGTPVRLPIDEEVEQHPESPYGITKMVAEHYLAYYRLDRGLQYTVLRYGNVYGPRQDSRGEAGVVAIFIQQLLTGHRPAIHWDGEQTRDYVFVDDVARANLLAATAGDGGTYCIGTGVGTSVNRLYEMTSDALGIRLAPSRTPRRTGDLRAAYFDACCARRDLGWEPSVTLEAGLARTAEAFRAATTRAREVHLDV